MTTVAIPAWNPQGLLPPIDSELPTSVHRSPYPVRLLDVVMRFSSSPDRRRILMGLLDYRAALHGLGITDGFQWLDGSFLEDVETLERRAPRDMDVVTFMHTPANFIDADLAPLDHDYAKAQFQVDAYIVELDEMPLGGLVNMSAYWYSMWSHRRNQSWKGFLRIDLAAGEDAQARQWLADFDGTEVQP